MHAYACADLLALFCNNDRAGRLRVSDEHKSAEKNGGCQTGIMDCFVCVGGTLHVPVYLAHEQRIQFAKRFYSTVLLIAVYQNTIASDTDNKLRQATKIK